MIMKEWMCGLSLMHWPSALAFFEDQMDCYFADVVLYLVRPSMNKDGGRPAVRRTLDEPLLVRILCFWTGFYSGVSAYLEITRPVYPQPSKA